MTSARPTPPPTGIPRRTLDTRARIALPLCGALLLGLAIHRLIIAEPAARPYSEFIGMTMGTSYSVKVATEDLSESERAALAQAIDRQLTRVDALMSTYREDSELSRFNRHASSDPFEFSKETMEVFRIARQVSEMTDGAFDITVGPLVTAWGFGATDRPPVPPSEKTRLELEQRVGYAKLIYDPTRPTVAKIDPRIECDLSAIAKGYGVDLVARAIADLGHSNYLVEIGGELRAHGRKLDGLPWRVGIEQPDSSTRSSHEIVLLRNISLATSGDYRDYYEASGQRISHTIDPRTGRPIAHRLASVSVLHPEAVWADALATALNVMGPVDGPAWAEAHDIPALFIVREDGTGFRTVASTGFEALRASP
jgi:thiamine biosynthesis lipoprotein